MNNIFEYEIINFEENESIFAENYANNTETND